jgi:hypothetical protein
MLEYLCAPRRSAPTLPCSFGQINTELSKVLKIATFAKKECDRTLMELSGRLRKYRIDGLLNFSPLPFHLPYAIWSEQITQNWFGCNMLNSGER